MLRTLTTATLLVLGIASAHAEDASLDDASTQVFYGDLNLAEPADAKTLAARLQDAASAVCLKANPENVSQVAMEACVSTSVHMAMSRIQSDMDEAVRGKLANVRLAMQDM